MSNILADIIDHKRAEVELRKAQTSFAELEALVAQQEPARNFFAAVTDHPDPFHVSIIAEIKRQSPSAGLIRPEYARDYRDARGGAGHTDGSADGKDGPQALFDPAVIARSYYANGAAAISCLTDEKYFAGSLAYIERIREAVPLPVLRKDFIVDPWQIWESRAAGADAVLLIAEVLTIAEIVDMHILSQRLGLTVLLEVHSMENLLRVRPHVGFPHKSYSLLGINNRNLETQTVNINHTLRLVEMVEDTSTLVSESGIKEFSDLLRLRKHNVRIALIGESLMREPDPGRGLAKVLNRAFRKPDNPPTPPRGV